MDLIRPGSGPSHLPCYSNAPTGAKPQRFLNAQQKSENFSRQSLQNEYEWRREMLDFFFLLSTSFSARRSWNLFFFGLLTLWRSSEVFSSFLSRLCSIEMNSSFGAITHRDILTAALSSNLIVGVPANTYVLWLILRSAKLGPDIFYFNLSLEEIFFSASSIFYYVALYVSSHKSLEVFIFFRGLFFTGRPLFQCLLCLECYMMVEKPVLFLHFKPLRHRLTCCAVCWLLVVLSCFYNKFTYHDRRHLFTFFVQSLLFLLVVIFCLVSVLRTLKSPGPGENNVQKKGKGKKLRAMKILSVTLMNMVVNFLLCLVPIPAQLFLTEPDFWRVLTVCSCLSYITGSMQVFIYLQRCGKISCLWLHSWLSLGFDNLTNWNCFLFFLLSCRNCDVLWVGLFSSTFTCFCFFLQLIHCICILTILSLMLAFQGRESAMPLETRHLFYDFTIYVWLSE